MYVFYVVFRRVCLVLWHIFSGFCSASFPTLLLAAWRLLWIREDDLLPPEGEGKKRQMQEGAFVILTKPLKLEQEQEEWCFRECVFSCLIVSF
jgi:hypothetical protein